MKVAVVYATLGRPDIVCAAASLLLEQTRRPDRTIISAVTRADVGALPEGLPVEVVFGPKGLPAQRNTGLRALGSDIDVVVFFDDDFAPAPEFLEQLLAVFSANEKIAGVTGRVVADGIGGPGYSFAEARKFLEDDARQPRPAQIRPVPSLYGCNMAIRMSAAQGLAFDESLPLYAWQEDVDYTVQLARRGGLVKADALAGVHLGVKRSRTPGVPMGYAQIANPIFLRRKRTMAVGAAYPLMARNVAMNLVRSLRPEPWCDRRGRLVGNLRAIADFFSGRLHPGNIVGMK